MEEFETHKQLYSLSADSSLLDEIFGSTLEMAIPDNKNKSIMPLNTILYGPPGTGKTYSTISKAINIINSSFDTERAHRGDVKNEFQRLVEEERIAFCTFHQSMSYEDFVEGIKPVMPKEDDTYLKYEIRDGIFKQLAKRASYVPDVKTKVFTISDTDFERASFYKMSLGDSQNSEDDVIYRYCIENNCISIGWGDDIDYTGLKEADINQLVAQGKIDATNGRFIKYFTQFLGQGDYVIISNGNFELRAIGKVTGGYKYDPYKIQYHHFRNVEWLLKDVSIPIQEMYDRNFSQQTIYQLDKNGLKKDFFVKAHVEETKGDKDRGNYVLIIDEINRGNVSAIFGELITLIEEDKRLGESEALTTTLPYSQKPFGVPSNLYIIGTMNTADRSVEALDAALRRRFHFEEMMPDYETLKGKQIQGIDLQKLLQTINGRISYLLDEDHQIGHSYFCNLEKNDIKGLSDAFRNKIIPLLKEYFYNDHEKIKWILGAGFVTETDDAPSFASGIKEETGRSIFRFVPIDDKMFVPALKMLLNES